MYLRESCVYSGVQFMLARSVLELIIQQAALNRAHVITNMNENKSKFKTMNNNFDHPKLNINVWKINEPSEDIIKIKLSVETTQSILSKVKVQTKTKQKHWLLKNSISMTTDDLRSWMLFINPNLFRWFLNISVTNERENSENYLKQWDAINIVTKYSNTNFKFKLWNVYKVECFKNYLNRTE